MNSTKQGVLSAIDFPLGQDEQAVSFAIGSLLKEGWEFTAITKTYIRLNRIWEVDTNLGMIEADALPNNPR